MAHVGAVMVAQAVSKIEADEIVIAFNIDWLGPPKKEEAVLS